MVCHGSYMYAPVHTNIIRLQEGNWLESMVNLIGFVQLFLVLKPFVEKFNFILIKMILIGIVDLSECLKI